MPDRFHRFGFVRVLLAGLFVWLLIMLHAILAMVVILATGLAALFGWRWLGASLRRHVEQGRGDWRNGWRG